MNFVKQFLTPQTSGQINALDDTSITQSNYPTAQSNYPTDTISLPSSPLPSRWSPSPYPMMEISCPGAPPIRIETGNLVRVTTTEGDKLRLRSSPEVADNIIKMIPAGTELMVIDGPMCSDDFSYWEIQIPGTTQTGWVAEGDYSIYYIEPVY